MPIQGQPHFLVNCYKNWTRHLVRVGKGHGSLHQEWDEQLANSSELHVLPDAGEFFVILREMPFQCETRPIDSDFDESLARVTADFEEFRRRAPEVPMEYRDAARHASYVQWSSLVAPEGFLKRETMFMSKNWMTNVWAWDHCFNALALSYGHPELAWDQFMVMFDHQDESGLIPDFLSDTHRFYNCCKPPIHGWTLRQLRGRMVLTEAQMLDAYRKIGAWTDWWLENRDADGDKVYEYWHGNDSGWDNSTVFEQGPVVESPDLGAFLVLQMDTLGDLATELGLVEEKKKWARLADRSFDALMTHCFQDGLPVPVMNGTHEQIHCRSLLPYMSILLGNRLPEESKRRMVEVLKGDAFRTVHGYATEEPTSQRYQPDGYWRGPIWAPSTLLIALGLDSCGETEMARRAAKDFCDMVKANGCAENYDASTGKGLRDRAYTWSASVFQILAHEYLN